MRKDKFIEMIARNLAGGEIVDDVKSKYHPKIVEEYVAAAYNDILFQQVRMSNQMKEFSSLDKYTKHYIVTTVEKDEDREEYYIDLPVPLMELSYGEALRYCGSPDGENDFIPRDPRANKVYAGLDTETVDSGIRRMIEHDRVYFRNMHSKPEKLLVKMLVPFQSWDRKEDVPMPAGSNTQVMERVISLMSTGTLPDNVNNQTQDSK